MSPWTLTKPVKRRNKAKENKERFFELISRMCKSDEGGENLIDIGDEEVTRDQLWTLGGLNKISNRVMSLVCKLLMGDMKKVGQVQRHIFGAYFMVLLARKPLGWNVAEWKNQLMPEKIGHNICECDLMIGPMLVADHWFCVALELKTMTFFVLDSMKPLSDIGTTKKRKKQSALDNPQQAVIEKIRDRFHDIVALVNPKHVGKKPKTDIIWAPIPQQNNLRDCGVHVMIWLNNWKPGVSIEYSEDEVREYRINLMWWLVNHDRNQRKEFALGLIDAQKTHTKRKRAT